MSKYNKPTAETIRCTYRHLTTSVPAIGKRCQSCGAFMDCKPKNSFDSDCVAWIPVRKKGN